MSTYFYWFVHLLSIKAPAVLVFEKRQPIMFYTAKRDKTANSETIITQLSSDRSEHEILIVSQQQLPPDSIAHLNCCLPIKNTKF